MLKVNILEETWNVLFAPFGELFPALPLGILYLVFFYVGFIHPPLLQHSGKTWKRWTHSLFFSLHRPSLGVLTVGPDACGCLWEGGEAAGLGGVHSAPWRRRRSRNRAGHPLAGDLKGSAQCQPTSANVSQHQQTELWQRKCFYLKRPPLSSTCESQSELHFRIMELRARSNFQTHWASRHTLESVACHRRCLHATDLQTGE